MEKVIYNSLLSSTNLEGDRYFYCNPMTWNGGHGKGHTTVPRWEEMNSYCCPPSISRTIASLHSWCYSFSNHSLWVNLYGSNTLKTTLPAGSPVELEQKTDYPWEGRIEINVTKMPDEPFDIMLRIPAWADDAKITVNGENVNEKVEPGTYCQLRRNWSPDDQVILELPMRVKLMEANSRLENLKNKVAVVRGPIVYCLELPVEHPNAQDIWNNGIYIPANVDLKPEFRDDMLGGIVTLKGSLLNEEGKQDFLNKIGDVSVSMHQKEWSDNELYREMEPRQIETKPEKGVYNVTLIPYYAWSNRGLSYMQVWLELAG